ncbi:glutamate-5-semialdehyde dehydrogenase [Halalkalibacter wakoensis]|uniref:glutamate-5-semialdehyde dehydrogenase n=1 Tax=Halalkalibacter wakoensis TaxID=127891 RepID=UPI00055703C3|nr:glutamate-5-semialdehyde dehydrogenase [Halalkalibacter wakoensis]
MGNLTKKTILSQANEAKKAAKSLSLLSSKEKNEALQKIADEIEKEASFILQENKKDLKIGRERHYDDAFMDRLALSEARILSIATSLREVTQLHDPVGDIIEEWNLDNGLHVKNIQVPLGVIGMIYEARPNVTVDATGLALKSGNAIVLKGGSSALYSNKALVSVIHQALVQTSIPTEAVQFIATADREITEQLFTMHHYIDVLIPRGGRSLIETVVKKATIPVLETGVGNVHMYIDEHADVKKVISIVVNAKTDRPAVCNALETLLINKTWFQRNKELLFSELKKCNITIHGDQVVTHHLPEALTATETDWAEEYLSLDLAIKIIGNVEEAIEHIDSYGTKHSEAIITEDPQVAKQFMQEVDAAAVYHNASTRFTDGGALGFGAEIGISTQKLHARGPMGLPALTTSKLCLSGNGQIR